MPFFGQDWRSPGEQWVKTKEGWETVKLWRVKIFESLNENVVARVNRRTIETDNAFHDETPRSQPHIVFNTGGSKEKLESTSLSEALVRLDMAGASRDIPRANFVIQLLFMILQKNLPTLSGTSQKMIFNIIETVFNEALKSEINIGGVKELIHCAKRALVDGQNNHIGSLNLWKKHTETIERLSQKLVDYNMKERSPDGKIMLPELPTECLRIIFSQIPNHEDLMRASQASLLLNEMTEESLLWKSMCIFHFNNNQISTFMNKPMDDKSVDWKYVYKRCYKRFGKKDSYTEMLSFCSHCCCIFWKFHGHPCLSSKPANSKDLSPKDFMILFKL